MVARRYLLYFSFNGSRFRGVQKQLTKNMKDKQDPTSVQGIMEIAFLKMNPKVPPELHFSARIPTGSHAIRASACVDLHLTSLNTTDYGIQKFVNKFFRHNKIDMRVISVQHICDNFNAYALPLWKSYMYKIAVLKPDAINADMLRYSILFPPYENRRYYSSPFAKSQKPTDFYLAPISATALKFYHFIFNSEFNIDKVREAIRLFINNAVVARFLMQGYEDSLDDISDVRIYDLNIHEEPSAFPPSYDYYNYFTILCQTKKRFMYKRIVSVLLAVAQNRLTIDDLNDAIKNPDSYDWLMAEHQRIPTTGLYLYDVVYHPIDLEMPIEKDMEFLTLDDKKQAIRKRIQNIRNRNFKNELKKLQANCIL